MEDPDKIRRTLPLKRPTIPVVLDGLRRVRAKVRTPPRDKTISFMKINGKRVKLYGTEHVLKIFSYKTVDGFEEMRRLRSVPTTILEMWGVKTLGTRKWFTIEELREYASVISLHRNKTKIHWAKAGPELKGRIFALYEKFKSGHLPLVEDRDAVEFYEKLAEKKARKNARTC